MTIEEQFVGAYLAPALKKALARAATATGKTMSAFLREMLERELGGIASTKQRRPGGGRRVAPRATLTYAFRAAVLASKRQDLAQRAGFVSRGSLIALLRRSTVALSPRTEALLRSVAGIVGYEGPLFEEAPCA